MSKILLKDIDSLPSGTIIAVVESAIGSSHNLTGQVGAFAVIPDNLINDRRLYFILPNHDVCIWHWADDGHAGNNEVWVEEYRKPL